MALSVVVLVGESQAVDYPTWWPRPRRLKVSGGTEPRAPMSARGVSCAALSRMEGLIERGVADGAALELDGRKPSVPATKGPTCAGPPSSAASSPGMTIYDQEIFGPVLCHDGRRRRSTKPLSIISANPNGNGTAIFTQCGRSSAQVPGRDRRRPGRHQRAHSCACASLLVHR